MRENGKTVAAVGCLIVLTSNSESATVAGTPAHPPRNRANSAGHGVKRVRGLDGLYDLPCEASVEMAEMIKR